MAQQLVRDADGLRLQRHRRVDGSAWRFDLLALVHDVAVAVVVDEAVEVLLGDDAAEDGYELGALLCGSLLPVIAQREPAQFFEIEGRVDLAPDLLPGLRRQGIATLLEHGLHPGIMCLEKGDRTRRRLVRVVGGSGMR